MIISNDEKIQPLIEQCEENFDPVSLKKSLLQLDQPQGNEQSLLY